jgi:aspartyl-tRNA(Asn)/glutamyl-tRNA(Gln) amidotransferase subunit A
MTGFHSLAMHEARILQADGGGTIQSMNEAMAMAARQENHTLGAFTHFIEEDSSTTSNHSLAGFFGAIKANIAGRGWPTHCGSQLLEEYCSPYDSTAVARLRAAGSRFMGITTMDEFGMGSSCEHTPLGRVVNPWDHSRCAGGSSGGSAAAVAAGLAWYALGSDTGGSVRLPAHFCAVVGLKPTWGRISRSGLMAFASSLDTIGILGRDVQDVHQVFLTLAGEDPHDATTLTEPVDCSPLTEAASLRGLKLGFPEDLSEMDLDEDVRRDHQESIRRLTHLGATVVPVTLGSILDAVPVYTVLNCAEAASNLNRFDGSLYGSRIPKNSYGETLEATRSHGFGSEVKRRLLLGAHVLSGGYQDQYYLRARAAREILVKDFKKLFSQIDVLALPTAPCTAFPLGRFLDDPLSMRKADVFTVPASLAGLPALTIPTQLDRHGLPLSLQLMGPPCSEKLLLESALVFENQVGFRSLKEAPWQRLV